MTSAVTTGATSGCLSQSQNHAGGLGDLPESPRAVDSAAVAGQVSLLKVVTSSPGSGEAHFWAGRLAARPWHTAHAFHLVPLWLARRLGGLVSGETGALK